ncbi:hypothetical protein, partial [Chitinophaga sp. GbtcB8]|uniref:hypothetical protein n=1 Tax=Chitinophaga sp. GbtcB8 TaxID=2824753 RepID=UPI001C2F9491
PPGYNGELIGPHHQKLSDLHLNGIGTGNQGKFFPYLLLLVGGFILFLACINFMSPTIVEAFTRSRGIGMRKILGAY